MDQMEDFHDRVKSAPIAPLDFEKKNVHSLLKESSFQLYNAIQRKKINFFITKFVELVASFSNM
jgi:hypothetical protein